MFRVPRRFGFVHSLAGILLCLIILMFGGSYLLYRDALHKYSALISVVTYDRNGIPLRVAENSKGHYAYSIDSLPARFEELLLTKEDRYFYYHLGVNPLSTLRALFSYIKEGDAGGGSTIHQQLAKNILGTESQRTLVNKLIESTYAISLELYLPKKDILTMYASTVFLGNQVQGFESGSYAYFGKPLKETTAGEQVALLATLSHPSTRNPWAKDNATYAEALYIRLGLGDSFMPPQQTKSYSFQHPAQFELETAGVRCTESCTTTIDEKVTDALRDMLKRLIDRERHRGVRNGAIVVIDPRTSELIALVGSPNPKSNDEGGQINMALAPRPIGSTIKPLLYLKGFMEGLRPYTLVDDREYRYPIATGFPLYPKNYDGKYHGVLTLHEALSNSLNVPSVKVLEFIGLQNFYQFLGDTLTFTPIQDFESYQYGIALGGLEMDLVTLTHYFTLFPRMGTIAPLKVYQSGGTRNDLPPQSAITNEKRVAEPEYTELVHTIISDRLTGVDQFGLKSSLNLSSSEYAVKTGTSRDFHDSWVVGYTPDFVVGVWLGNSENEALDQVSGQSGAGSLWHEVMEYLLASPYRTDASFSQKDIRSIPLEGSLEFGLASDVALEHRGLLTEDVLITSPHESDRFELTPTTNIPLIATKDVTWTINGKLLGVGSTATFTPLEIGNYEVQATDDAGEREIVLITITRPE